MALNGEKRHSNGAAMKPDRHPRKNTLEMEIQTVNYQSLSLLKSHLFQTCGKKEHWQNTGNWRKPSARKF